MKTNGGITRCTNSPHNRNKAVQVNWTFFWQEGEKKQIFTQYPNNLMELPFNTVFRQILSFLSDSYHWNAFTDQNLGQTFGSVSEEWTQLADPYQTQGDPTQTVKDAEHATTFSPGSNITKTCRLQEEILAHNTEVQGMFYKGWYKSNYWLHQCLISHLLILYGFGLPC